MNIVLEKLAPLIEWNEEVRDIYDNEFFIEHSSSQEPWITLLSCCDSRVHPHVLLEEPINQIFDVNVIGNAVETAKGSLDYGIYHLKTPILLILGHSDCGAVKACLAGYDDEPDSIKNALKPVNDSYCCGKSSEVYENVIKNINHQTKVATEAYKELVDSKDLVVVGAFYDIGNDLGKGFGELVILTINNKAVKL